MVIQTTNIDNEEIASQLEDIYSELFGDSNYRQIIAPMSLQTIAEGLSQEPISKTVAAFESSLSTSIEAFAKVTTYVTEAEEFIVSWRIKIQDFISRVLVEIPKKLINELIKLALEGLLSLIKEVPSIKLLVQILVILIETQNKDVASLKWMSGNTMSAKQFDSDQERPKFLQRHPSRKDMSFLSPLPIDNTNPKSYATPSELIADALDEWDNAPDAIHSVFAIIGGAIPVGVLEYLGNEIQDAVYDLIDEPLVGKILELFNLKHSDVTSLLSKFKFFADQGPSHGITSVSVERGRTWEGDAYYYFQVRVDPSLLMETPSLFLELELNTTDFMMQKKKIEFRKHPLLDVKSFPVFKVRLKDAFTGSTLISDKVVDTDEKVLKIINEATTITRVKLYKVTSSGKNVLISVRRFIPDELNSGGKRNHHSWEGYSITGLDDVGNTFSNALTDLANAFLIGGDSLLSIGNDIASKVTALVRQIESLASEALSFSRIILKAMALLVKSANLLNYVVMSVYEGDAASINSEWQKYEEVMGIEPGVGYAIVLLTSSIIYESDTKKNNAETAENMIKLLKNSVETLKKINKEDLTSQLTEGLPPESSMANVETIVPDFLSEEHANPEIDTGLTIKNPINTPNETLGEVEDGSPSDNVSSTVNLEIYDVTFTAKEKAGNSS